MGKRIAVLGGAGLIGTHLCLRLLNEGHEVFCIDIRDVGDSPLLSEVCVRKEFHYVKHNIVHSFTIHCDEIYNLTAPARLRYDRILPVEMLKTDLLGSINTLEAARIQQTKVLYASSGDVYRALCHEPAIEDGRHNPVKYLLAEAKRTGEALHRAYHEQYGVDTRIARIFNTYGSGVDIEDQHGIVKMIVAALRNRDIAIYGSGEQIRTFCWVDDIADGLVKLMAATPSKDSKSINLGGSHEISICALAEKIISVTGSRSRIVHTPARFDDPHRRTPDLSVTKRELNWLPTTPLAEGLKRTIEYIGTELSRAAWSKINC